MNTTNNSPLQFPGTNAGRDDTKDPAVEIIRQKIDTLYAHEPDVAEEALKAEQAGAHRSKHQQFMHKLSNSGKSLAEIQTEWHNYYIALPDHEKHVVWQEFYTRHAQQKQTAPHSTQVQPQTTHHAAAHQPSGHTAPQANDLRSVADIKKQITRRVSNRNRVKLSKAQHFKSLLFGFGLGSIVLLILLFGFFNERFIAPFVTPSKAVSSTPLIIDPSTTAVGPESKIIIPKINVEIPVVYDAQSVQEDDIQAALEHGVVHYPTTPMPGEQGNTVIVGHSSNNIFNGGKYKFAFVLLRNLEIGDTFILQKGGKRYVYRIYEKRVVPPTDISVLGPTDKPATATLITCDPPGTSINRLIIVGEQISPDPSDNAPSSVSPDTAQPAIVPGNAPSLWERFTNWIIGR